MNVQIIKLDKTMKDPLQGTSGSAGLDLRASGDLVLQPGQTGKVGLGVAVALPDGYAGLLLPRSGGKSFVLTNTVGLLDQDYQGQLIASVRNIGREPLLIQKDDRIVQLVVVPCLLPTSECIQYVDKFDEKTERGEGGFHSTGDK